MRRILYLLNVLLILASFALCIYAIVMFFINPQDWVFTLELLGIGVGSGILFFILYVVRKSYFPLPGIDYK
ncbi:MAG: hypothetical protein ISR57_09835 [Bacteroidales bacterium]|nr:hypothetical protein [Bacteroidales bacterium]